MTPFNRRLVYLILLYTCIEGLVVNVTFPSKLGYVAKDIMLAVSLGLLLIGNNGQNFGSLRRLSMPIGLFVFVQLCYMIVPSDLPLLAKAVGLKMRVLYIASMLLGYRFVRAPQDAYRLAAILVLAAIPVSLFGIYLYFAGPSALQAIGGTYSAIVYSTTGVWRVPGTFTSPGQYGLYLMFSSVVAIGLLLTSNLTARMRGLLWVSLGFMTLASMASGSRSPLLLTFAAAGLALLALGKLSRIFSMGVGVYLVFAIGFATLGSGVEDRVGSIASFSHVERFQHTYFGQMFLPDVMKSPLGMGLGSATIGARHFTEFNEILLVESYLGIVAIETGILGLLTILGVLGAVGAFIAKCRPVMRDAGSAPIWHALAVFMLLTILLTPVSTPLDAPPGNLYFWMSLGIVAKLYDLHRWAKASELMRANGVPLTA
jgi:hypothetical protein